MHDNSSSLLFIYAKMKNADWDDLRHFLAVSSLGSLSKAAAELGASHSTVLRRLAQLERRLGVRLFDRHMQGYAITEAGQQLHDQLAHVADEIESAQRRLAGRDTRLSGAVRVTTTDTCFYGLLSPHLSAFREAHPDIELQFVIHNSFMNLTRREADVAIRPTHRPPEHLVGRPVGVMRSAVYASMAYLERHGLSTSLGIDLAACDWVVPDESLSHLAQARWMDQRWPGHRVACRIDTLLGMAQAVRAGLGAGVLLCLLADADGSLVRLQGPWPELDTPLWILTHPALKRTARIRAFVDFMQERLAADHRLAGLPGTKPRRGGYSPSQ